jgi:hypothetical protein
LQAGALGAAQHAQYEKRPDSRVGCNRAELFGRDRRSEKPLVWAILRMCIENRIASLSFIA